MCAALVQCFKKLYISIREEEGNSGVLYSVNDVKQKCAESKKTSVYIESLLWSI